MRKNNNKSKHKKSITIITLIIAIIGITFAIYIFNNNTNNNDDSSYTAKRTSSDENNNSNNDNNNTDIKNTETNKAEETPPTPPKETEIASFTTKIYSTDSARQNNINITCSKLNNIIVKKGETFSFCLTVGQATSSKGYKKADIFDKNGNKKKGLGGRKLSN